MLLTDAQYTNKILKIPGPDRSAEYNFTHCSLYYFGPILRVSSNMSICISRGVAYRYSVREADKPVNNATDRIISVGEGKMRLNTMISRLDGLELLKYTRSVT